MSTTRVFVTGGSGFVGRGLLRELTHVPELEVLALDRSGKLSADRGLHGIRIVQGDLLNPGTYEQHLRDCDTVVHLAAATGKATAATHFRETAKGTEVLLEASKRAGVQKILFVSSVAAAFPEKSGYPYAQAKEQAERVVATSGLRYTIIRPTMILGDGSPILSALSALALLPVIVLPGRKRVRVQPVAVNDVVKAMVLLLSSNHFQGETFDIGGAEVLDLEELLQRIRVARTGSRGPLVRLPVGLIQAPLRVAERLGLTRWLPATAGQFSSFKYDGVATPNALLQDLQAGLQPVESMFATASVRDAGSGSTLHRECRVFTRYLIGHEPDALVVRSYERAVASLPALAATSAWERSLLAVARRGTFAVRCADAHAALFARSTALRKRLVMLLAILETRAPFSDTLDRAPAGSLPIVAATLGLRVVGSILAMILGSIILVPVRIFHSARGGTSA